jgi:hypothetical protein
MEKSLQHLLEKDLVKEEDLLQENITSKILMK